MLKATSSSKPYPASRANNSRAQTLTSQIDSHENTNGRETPNRSFLQTFSQKRPLTKEQKSLNAAIEAVNRTALAEHIDISKLASASYVWDPSAVRRQRFSKSRNKRMPFEDISALDIGLIQDTSVYRDKRSLEPNLASVTTSSTQVSGTKSAQHPAPADNTCWQHETSLVEDESPSDLDDMQPNRSSTAPKKKKKKKKRLAPFVDASPSMDHAAQLENTLLGSPTKATMATQDSGHDSARIWKTSNEEERQRIRAFWFGLPEQERRTIVSLEKEAVLEKMKELQRHACACAVCGRKRDAIEKELVHLYDTYYYNLERYTGATNQPKNPQPSNDAVPEIIAQESAPIYSTAASNQRQEEGECRSCKECHGIIVDSGNTAGANIMNAHVGKSGLGIRDARAQLQSTALHNTPNVAQRPDVLLEVAQDLLGNNAEKFQGMLRTLELEGRLDYSPRQPITPNTIPATMETDALTKELYMDEGRKMFQAFAARMFEQRVMSAYREHITEERRLRLLQELEEETRQEQLRDKRKEREKEKKREKKR
ncbi:Stress response protein nst1 [Podila humilis]|nr:Stress response protein nst1 [Podila humilis]